MEQNSSTGQLETVQGAMGSEVVNAAAAAGAHSLQDGVQHNEPVHVNMIIIESHPRYSEATMQRQVAAFYMILVVMVIGQMLLVWWKAKHKRSYELVTLIGLWIIPAFISFELSFWRFVLVWLLFTSISAYILAQCTSKTISSSTPRLVYTWFLGVFKVTISMGVCGYGLIFLELFGMGPMLRLILPTTISIDLLWYGLYFGILGRDCAEVASDWMQSRLLGGGRKLTVQVNKCGICNKDISNGPVEEETQAEKTISLDCKHRFHEHCLRGWTIVGKKDVCPTCLEKVDLKNLYSDRPWETSNLSWIKMLDGVRYLVVWNPIIFVFLHFAMHFFGMDPAAEERSVHVVA